jgi:hypothetical protein
MRSFTVGTGGTGLGPPGPTVASGSEVRFSGAYGVLRLTLHPDGYGWEFLTVGGVPIDRGEARCHD